MLDKESARAYFTDVHLLVPLPVQGMAMLDKKSIKLDAINAFDWSPADPILCAYQGEQGNLPARVVLIRCVWSIVYLVFQLGTRRACTSPLGWDIVSSHPRLAGQLCCLLATGLGAATVAR